jgi:hypothetical protein
MQFIMNEFVYLKKYSGFIKNCDGTEKIIFGTGPVFNDEEEAKKYLDELVKRIKSTLSRDDLELPLQELSAKIFDEKFRDLCD